MQIYIATMIITTLTVLAGISEACGRGSKGKDTSQTSTEDASRWLRQFQWKNRLLVISAADKADLEYQRQWNMLKDEVCEMGLRNMAVISLFANDASSSNAKVMVYSNNDGEIQESAVPATIVNGLIQYLNLPSNNFGMVLVGKDGGVKERYPRPTSPLSVFAKIDRMPMRRREAREQQARGMVCK